MTELTTHTADEIRYKDLAAEFGWDAALAATAHYKAELAAGKNPEDISFELLPKSARRRGPKSVRTLNTLWGTKFSSYREVETLMESTRSFTSPGGIRFGLTDVGPEGLRLTGSHMDPR
ncbi:MAG: hypothetical protein LBG06_11615 [Deltaproteobacteria bacterium]|nr:hypothetical protein [Deltaproteobacteria bacterium]